MNLLEALISMLFRKVMPPKRMMEDVDDGGEAVDEEEIIQQIKIVRREESMCDIQDTRGKSINVKNLFANNID